MANWKIIIMYYKELCKYKVHIGIAEMESPSIPIAGLWVDVCIAFAHGLCQPLAHFRPPGSSQVLSKKNPGHIIESCYGPVKPCQSIRNILSKSWYDEKTYIPKAYYNTNTGQHLCTLETSRSEQELVWICKVINAIFQIRNWFWN